MLHQRCNIIKFPFALLFATLFISSCSSTKEENHLCYSFDLRQCNEDPWNTDITSPITQEVLTDACRAYLNSEGISTSSISIDMAYHTIVCEACVVCPLGPRYYVSIEADEASLLRQQELLNFQAADCRLLAN